jgi:hypothetical protein
MCYNTMEARHLAYCGSHLAKRCCRPQGRNLLGINADQAKSRQIKPFQASRLFHPLHVPPVKISRLPNPDDRVNPVP